METTKLQYLEDFTLVESEAEVIAVNEEDDKKFIILDKTIFYPQGGGQPYDQGIIEADLGTFQVNEVRFSEGTVKHFGEFIEGSFSVGEQVQCHIDVSRRELHSRIHSAGHIVDMAVHNLGLKWIPGKGYHFPDAPYVEYEGSLEGYEKEQLKNDIEKLCNKLIQEDHITELRFIPTEKMQEVCHFVPDYIPQDKPARVVMYGDFGVPCGGTHVSHLGEVGVMTIRKIKAKGSIIRVGYNIT